MALAHTYKISGFLLLINLVACSTGIEPSPDPGTLRITLESDPTDRSLIIVTDPVEVGTEDQFDLTIFQGKAFRDSVFFVLFNHPATNQQRDQIINILEQEGDGYASHTIFESYLPPGGYTRFEFGISTNEFRVASFTIPVRLSPSTTVLQGFSTQFDIEPGRTTEIVVQIKPLQSVKRFRNQFLFEANLDVIDVRMLP